MSWGKLSPKSPDNVPEPVTVRKSLLPEDTQKLQLSPHGRGARIDMVVLERHGHIFYNWLVLERSIPHDGLGILIFLMAWLISIP